MMDEDNTSDRRYVTGVTHASLRLVLIILLGVTLLGGVAAADHLGTSDLEGSGTASDPYNVSNVHELQAIQDDPSAHYQLVSDIDASATEDWNGGFEPVGYDTQDDSVQFTGTLDGQGHTISNLSSQRVNHAGLIGRHAGTVERLHLKDVDIFAQDWEAGGLAATIEGGTVTNVTVQGGTVHSPGRRAGGIAGEMYGGSVDQSHADVDVTGGWSVGGLVGWANSGGTITDSYAHGSVHGNQDAGQAGGLVGYLHGDSGTSLERSYTTATVSCEACDSDYQGVGGAIGYAPPSDKPSVSKVYWSAGLSDQSSGLGGGDINGALTERSSGEMTGDSASTNMDLDFTDVFTTTDTYPAFQWMYTDPGISITSQSAVINGDETTNTDGLDTLVGVTDEFTAEMSEQATTARLYVSGDQVDVKDISSNNVTFEHYWPEQDSDVPVWIEFETSDGSTVTATWSVNANNIIIEGPDSYARQAGTAVQVSQTFTTLGQDIDVTMAYDDDVLTLISGPTATTVNSGETVTWEFIVEQAGYSGEPIQLHAISEADDGTQMSQDKYISISSRESGAGFLWAEGDDPPWLIMGGVAVFVLGLIQWRVGIMVFGSALWNMTLGRVL